MLAVISDVHGNLTALEAVLADIGRAGADELVCLGDVASFGPEPRETLRRVQALRCPVVMGNADWELLDAPSRQAFGSGVAFDIAAWCAEQLSDTDRAFIKTFKKTVRLELEGLSVLCFHGSPASYDDIIVATTPDETLAGLFVERAPLMFGGHTHVQLFRRYQDLLLVNPGSVGLPFETLADGRTRNPAWAGYALVTALRGQPSVTFRRVLYDVNLLLAAAETSGMPHAKAWSAD